MRILITLLLLFSTSTYADFKDWSKKEQNLYNSMITLQTMDLIQTFVMIECQETNPHCPFYERNPILGTHPSKGEALVFKVAANYMIFKILDQPKFQLNGRRERLLKGLNVISVYPVISNEQVGLGFYIPFVPYRSFK